LYQEHLLPPSTETRNVQYSFCISVFLVYISRVFKAYLCNSRTNVVIFVLTKFRRLYLSNGQAYGTLVVCRPSVCRRRL